MNININVNVFVIEYILSSIDCVGLFNGSIKVERGKLIPISFEKLVLEFHPKEINKGIIITIGV
jgi:hypothetical protein